MASASQLSQPSIDFSEDTPVVTQDALSLVTLTAQRLIDEQDEVIKLERKLTDSKERARLLEEKELPDAMAAAQLTEFKMTNGKMITVKDVIAGSPSKKGFETAVSWLTTHEHDGIVKRSVSLSVNFAKGQGEQADELLKYLQELEYLQELGIMPEDKPSIHYQTFGAWARELHATHKEEHLALAVVSEHCPFCSEDITKLLGIYVGKKAEVKDLKK